MVIEKLDALESAMSKVLEELASLRRTRTELESQLESEREKARSGAESARAQVEELERLRAQNAELQKAQGEIQERVEKILQHIG